MNKTEKKVTLVEALTIVVTALKNDTIYYKWKDTNTCNCGLVAQAVTRTNKDELDELYLQPIASPIQVKNKSKFSPTWSDMVAEYCPLTKEPVTEIFKKLFDAGMTREDIGHLEYLSDPEILEKININLDTTEKYFVKRTKTKSFLGLGFKKKTISVRVQKTRKVYYYQKKENLIAYLEAWIEILEDKEAKESVIIIDGREYRYQNDIQLDNLKKDFLKKENYRAVTKIQEELNKLNENK